MSRRRREVHTGMPPPLPAVNFRGEQEPGMLQSSLIHRLASRAGAASRLLCWLAVLLVSLPLAAFAATDADGVGIAAIEVTDPRSEEHTSELQSLMRISYAVFCLKKKKKKKR